MNNLHTYSLLPVITLPTRVTKTTSTLIDNFLCDISLLSLCSSVIKTDISDYYLIELSLNLPSSSNTVTKRPFFANNKLTFVQKLLDADWAHLYSLLDADLAFNFIIKKIKRIYNKCFPFVNIYIQSKNLSWLIKGILKSIRHKNNYF